MPDQRTWSGRRDHALLLLTVQTGLHLSELTSLRPEDLHTGEGAHVRVFGKGRKERCMPLSKKSPRRFSRLGSGATASWRNRHCSQMHGAAG
ncbi:tyrosine-type recombinase/integrase [Cupriavidus taiwanensis]|uniref:tyrosine-type recombinase/integrase n=1 Tax=Cupriavidus taiwanensis TaxID=164546 RepID=UPI002F935CEA